jgi:hypothetical protein
VHTLKQAIAQPRSFGRESPVLEYWLGRCEGFELVSTSGGQLGVVEQVMLDDAGRARALVMRTTILGRRRTVDPRLAESVVPESEAIAVRPEAVPPAAGEARGSATRGVVQAVHRVGPPLQGASGGLARLLGATFVKALSVTVASSRWGAGRLRRYAPVVVRHIRESSVAAVRWARPRAAAVARLALAMLVGLTALLVTIVRELGLAVRAYREARARETAHRRSAAETPTSRDTMTR